MTVEQLHDEMGELEPSGEGHATDALTGLESIAEPELQLATEGDEAAPVTDAEERAVLLAAVPEVVLAEPPVSELEAVEPGEEAPVAEPAAEPAPVPQAIAFDIPVSSNVSIWPFFAYGVVWVAFAGLVIWQLLEVPAGVAVYDAPVYPLTLVGGLALIATGPALIIASWFASRGRVDATSGQLFISALVRGSLATVFGTALWWAALIAVDQIRLGRLL